MSQQLIFHPSPNQYRYNEYEIQLLQHAHNPYEVKHRKRTSRFQLSILEATFAENPKPSSAVKKQIAVQTNMSMRGIQVWFQNRRAKAKNLLLKAAASSRGQEEQEPDEDDMSDPGPLTDGDRITTPLASPRLQSATLSPTTSPVSGLRPPSNLALRRGSAPAPLGLGLPTFQEQDSPGKDIPPDSAEETPSTGYLAPLLPPSFNSRNIPNQSDPTAFLGRRRSLPAFHPQHQAYFRQPQPPPVLPHSRMVSSPAVPYLANNHPTTHAYRSGSSPGIIPINNFNQPQSRSMATPFWQRSHNPAHGQSQVHRMGDDSNGLPYTFAPRRVPPSFGPGPLPRADFSFGVREDEHEGETSDPSADTTNMPNGEEYDRGGDVPTLSVDFTNPQAHRFGSMASIASSIVSVESDATGTTGTTSVSSAGHHPPSAHRSQLQLAADVGVVPNGMPGTNMSTFSPNFSFGASPGGAVGLRGPEAIQFPNGFDPDARRASCPAQFVDMFSHLGVHRPHMGSQNSLSPQNSFNQFTQPLNTCGRNYSLRGVRKSPSFMFPGKSPLGLAEDPESPLTANPAYQPFLQPSPPHNEANADQIWATENPFAFPPKQAQVISDTPQYTQAPSSDSPASSNGSAPTGTQPMNSSINGNDSYAGAPEVHPTYSDGDQSAPDYDYDNSQYSSLDYPTSATSQIFDGYSLPDNQAYTQQGYTGITRGGLTEEPSQIHSSYPVEHAPYDHYGAGGFATEYPYPAEDYLQPAGSLYNDSTGHPLGYNHSSSSLLAPHALVASTSSSSLAGALQCAPDTRS